ncbi:hypothetical protein [Intestinimonas butyriciproducens]|uniref:hypothetical protein n=1 Tax=Intestinimonas butyriciproducens TaxID=1297617 RepID=UPI0031F65BB4
MQAQVDAVGRETVTGNVLIWFLCAIGFLKAAQKIDSFMASLGVNVGHTGGSMLAEALIAARGVGTIAGAMGHSLGAAGGHRGSSGGNSAAASAGGFFKGGLIGMARRKATSDAVRSATSSTSAVRSEQVKSTSEQTASHSAHTSEQAGVRQTATHEGHQTVQQTAAKTAEHTSHTASEVTRTQHHTASSFQGVGLGGAIFAKSLLKGGDFANDVIGTVARGDIRSAGSITGDLAAQSLQSYLGYTALGADAKDTPAFTNVEIGGGRITGTETAPGSSEGVAFGMYHADQYTEPKGDFTKVHAADGSLWYKQYAQDAVERKPYNAPDGTVAYQESIVKRLPDPPKRKDRL